jgi:uncharacterized protein
MVKFVPVLLLALLLNSFNPGYASHWRRILVDGNVSIQVEVVTTAKEKAKGLGGRFSLPEGMGMLFQYNWIGEHTFWMKNMHFPIDIIWIDRGVIVHIEKKVPPPRSGASDRSLPVYGRGINADMVLEVPAGYTSKKSIIEGSTVQIKPK